MKYFLVAKNRYISKHLQNKVNSILHLKSFPFYFVNCILVWNKIRNLTKKFNLRRYVLSCPKTASIKFKKCREAKKYVKTWQITNELHTHTNERSCKCWAMVNKRTTFLVFIILWSFQVIRSSNLFTEGCVG